MSDGPPPRPPRLLRRVLGLMLPRADREALLGDLDDLFGARVRARGHARAHRWYLRQVPSFALRLAAHSLGRGFRALTDPDLYRSLFSVDALFRDARHAVRVLLRRPAFTVVAVLSLALGIGANTAMFSLVNSILLRPLPVEDPESLVELYTSDSDGFVHATSSYPDFRDLWEENDVFQGMVAYQLFISTTERGDGPPEVIMGELVTGDYFRVLGIRPALGRVLLPEDDVVPGGHPVAVLGHRAWQADYAGDPDIVGRTLRLNQRPFTVVGVLAEDFNGMTRGLSPDAWVPYAMIDEIMPAGVSRLESRGSRSLFVKARLREGVTIEQAGAWVGAFSTRLAEAHPETNAERTMTLVPTTDVALHPMVDRMLMPVAALLLSVVGVVLLIACANLASFLLARAERRRKDVAVRLALGAGRMVLVRQFLVETVLLALAGGVAGLVLAEGIIRALLRFQPPIMIPVNLDVGLDGSVLAFTAGVAVLAGLLFGLAPALHATRADVAGTLKEGGERGGSPRGFNVRNGLVVVQVALSLVLLTGAGLFLRSLQEAGAVDTGFDTGPAAILWPNMQMTGLSEEEGRSTFLALEEHLLAHPAVDAVAFTDALPLGASVQTTGVRIPGMESASPDGLHSVDVASVSPGWFEVMGVPLLAGRTFGPEDGAMAGNGPEAGRAGGGSGMGVSGGVGGAAAGDRVAVVSEAFVRRFWPDEGGPAGAVGRSFELRSGDMVRVVGVSADTKVRTLSEAPRPRIHYSTTQQYTDALQIVVRGSGSSAELLAAARGVAREVEPDLVIFEAKTMEEHLALMLFAPRMAALLLSVFGGLALLLAAIGIFGVVSYAVATRTREIGIRVSLGATPTSVVGMVVGGGMRLVGIGGVVGLLLALATGALLGRFLIGVEGWDLATFVAIPLVLGSVAFVAAWVPARRAARVDPSEALRTE